MKILPALILFAFPVAIPGCDEKSAPEYSGFEHIPAQGIPLGWEFEFNPLAEDSVTLLSGTHDVAVAIRYTNRCKARDVIINVEEISLLHDNPDSLTVTIPLFDKYGEPVGKGNFGIYEVTDTIRRGMRVPEGYTISLSSPLPDSVTSGINAIGVIVF
ncbi:MAG: gliding motility lipoprotein GldH [Bacteroides sp.]|nr:gliding motility lipoprotein GldH [Bacteroides sp.]